jgi:hypothetical protein
MSAIAKRPRTLRLILSGALALCLLLLSASPAVAAEEKYEIKSASVSLSTTQAGAHADLTTAFEVNSEKNTPIGLTRDVDVHLPPGVIGNPQAIPRCSLLQFGGSAEETCPVNTQVGVVDITLGGDSPGTFTEPLYNLEPPKDSDVVARFGFYAAIFPAVVNVRVDPHDYSLVASVEGASASAGLISAKTTIWGVPADPIHNEFRITSKEALEHNGPPGGRPSGLPEVPFISNPTDCALERQVTITATSYQEPESHVSKTASYPQITGCGKLAFDPTFSLTPTNPEASAPTGLEAELKIPQDETPKGLATSTLKGAVVSLPEGMTINAAAGNGLEACSAQAVHFEENVPAQCPAAAKIGSAEIDVPALEHVLKGAVYQRTPEPGHLFRFWLVSDELGVHLKLPAEINTNPLTGQVTTLFLGIQSLGGNPQVPVREIKLHVASGPRAPLATPPACGTYQTHYEFIPWSGKPPTVGDTPMQIINGCGKGGFAPGFEAGSLSLRAGAFAPFTMTLTRQDGEAKPASLEVHLPQGLLAKLGGVPLCSDADAATANCPASSQVGTLNAASGVGPLPLWIPQPGKSPTAIYLSGPYKGAPYSIVAKVPAQAGPFDLGTIVNRSAIYVDPNTALATVKTDPLPQILEGVPILLRALHVDINRPEFTLNPTSCKEKQISVHVQATDGQVTNPDPSVPFQATNCAKLAYTPHLKLSFKGSTKRSGNPAVSATLTQPPGQANTAATTVILPSSEFIDQSHINNPCTRVQFNANECPPGSILGHVKAISPLLDQPLEGPVYFRSNGGERELPDIVADLGGQIHVILVGFVDSVHKKGSEVSRVRTRFMNVPDAPVTSFKISFFGGKKGLIENHVSLCAKKRRVKLSFTAQNGRTQNTEPAIGIAGCK